MEKPRVVINHWALENLGLENRSKNVNPHPIYLYRLTGIIEEGHPRLAPGSAIYTSLIENLDLANGVCETLNTLYVLGIPGERLDPHW